MFFHHIKPIIITMREISPLKTRSGESGNALWFIMLAIALLAALTITITRSSDSVEQSGDFERARVHATHILRYVSGLEKTIDQMRMRGISENDISFHDSGWGNNNYQHSPALPNSNRIFHVEGAGLNFPDIGGASNWIIFGDRSVDSLETSSHELIIQAEVSKNICTQINAIAGITGPSDDPPTDVITAPTEFTGSFTDGGEANLVIGDEAAGFSGEPTGCREDGGIYYFYHVLIER